MWVGLTRRWWRGRLSRGEWSRTVAEVEHAAVLRGGRKALGGLCSAFRGTRRDETISTPPPSSSHLYLRVHVSDSLRPSLPCMLPPTASPAISFEPQKNPLRVSLRPVLQLSFVTHLLLLSPGGLSRCARLSQCTHG
ncbi:hypothetical protein C4D60_Mb07t18740 [Musa balbisiana]|uniref:Uncharacterized protein n=1 Tax=Musa balbisiana TaxID=52838 RepID=A0A4S8JGA1_MUSBA|nr:hypothetical protein C4D60_Mb07t18740 [Musa balbisiana]